jgi:hypothetical protein
MKIIPDAATLAAGPTPRAVDPGLRVQIERAKDNIIDLSIVHDDRRRERECAQRAEDEAVQELEATVNEIVPTLILRAAAGSVK